MATGIDFGRRRGVRARSARSAAERAGRDEREATIDQRRDREMAAADEANPDDHRDEEPFQTD